MCHPYRKSSCLLGNLSLIINVHLSFFAWEFVIKELGTQKVLMVRKSDGDLYPIPNSVLQRHVSLVTPLASPEIWHRRLGYPAAKILSFLSSNKLISMSSSSRKLQTFIYEHNRLGKSSQFPFTLSSSHASMPLAVVHSDVWTSHVLSHGSFKYYVVFIDEFSRFSWAYAMRNKSEVFYAFLTSRIWLKIFLVAK